MAMQRSEGESERITLGPALAAHIRLIVWCKTCNHRVANHVAQHGS